MPSGNGLLLSCPARRATRAGRGRTIAGSWRRCRGLCARGRHGALAVIPAKADRKTPIRHDVEMYKWRRLIENFFQRLKEFRRIATRYDKTDASFAAAIYLAAAFLALK